MCKIFKKQTINGFIELLLIKSKKKKTLNNNIWGKKHTYLIKLRSCEDNI